MAEPKKPAPVPPPEPPPSPLGSAAASTDQAVHYLIAELETARRNGDTEAAEALTGRLAALGVA